MNKKIRLSYHRERGNSDIYYTKYKDLYPVFYQMANGDLEEESIYFLTANKRTWYRHGFLYTDKDGYGSMYRRFYTNINGKIQRIETHPHQLFGDVYHPSSSTENMVVDEILVVRVWEDFAGYSITVTVYDMKDKSDVIYFTNDTFELDPDFDTTNPDIYIPNI